MTQHFTEWQPSYELGIEDIDLQHHFFLNLINKLSDELKGSADSERRNALIRELNAYAHFHFVSEENMMQKAGYPKLDEHKRHHRELIDQLSTKQNLLTIKGTDGDAGEIVEFLLNWFLSHTVHEDRLFADFVHGNSQT